MARWMKRLTASLTTPVNEKHLWDVLYKPVPVLQVTERSNTEITGAGKIPALTLA